MQTIVTNYGELVPQHTTDDLRKKDIIPVVLHQNGIPKSLPLEEQTTIATPVGDIPAELLTFHENGSLNRIFPLNGKLSGYWSEADELALAKPVIVRTPAGTIAARILGINFYSNETIRSVTLWPGEIVTIDTPAGRMETRIGISFMPDGTIESVEPAKPTLVRTMAGDMLAYDPDTIGLCGDTNSLVTDAHGTIHQLKTTLTSISSTSTTGKESQFSPKYRDSYCSEEEKEIEPMTVEFSDDFVTIKQTPRTTIRLSVSEHTFSTQPYLPQLAQGLGGLKCSV
ncbi:hypothetical protein OAN24_03190 [Pseudodesulfovibrio sp.]|nr:hypothetical protein [Pseudodesulfovibrio sp.]